MPIPLKPAQSNDERGQSTGIGGGFETKESYSLAYQVISSASVLDAWRQDLFVQLLGGGESVGAAAYLAINTRAPKIAAITSAAKAALPEYMFDRFTKLLNAGDALEKYRDKIAHWQEYRIFREPDELCLRDPSAPRDRLKPPALGIYVFPKDEMKRYINYAVNLSVAQMEFRRLLVEGEPWPESKFAQLDQKLEDLAKERQRL